MSALPETSVVIPLRHGADPACTLESLAKQSYRDFEVVLSQDQKDNANWARNQGFSLTRSTKYILFSDDDITWAPRALEILVEKLEASKHAAYSYCAYRMGDRVQCAQEFSATTLRRRNFISTMSLIRRERFIGFDEGISRLQDWDLWLGMLARGDIGVYCGATLFETYMRDGITYSPRSISYQDAVTIVLKKHGLP